MASVSAEQDRVTEAMKFLAEHLLEWTRCSTHNTVPCHGWLAPTASIHKPIAWLGTPNGMMAVLEAMRERDYSAGLLYCQNGRQHGAAFYKIGARPYPPLEVLENLHRERREGTSGAPSLPAAVALAAEASLRGEK